MSDGAAPRFGPRSKFALRVIVTVVALAIIFTKLPHEDVIPDEHHVALTIFLLILAVLTTFLGVVLSAWRWQRVLHVFEVDVPLKELTQHYLVGLFAGNALPSTVGGDVVRISRASGSTGSTQIAFASVVLERLTGFVALPLLVFLGLAIKPSLLDNNQAWAAVLVAAITLMILVIVLFIAGHPRIAGRYADHENWARFIGAVHIGVDRLRRDPRQLGPVLGTAFLYQFSVVVTFCLVFRALDLPIPLAGALAFSPAVLMIQVLPISLAGIGLREGALVLFMHPFLEGTGIPDSRVAAAGLLWYGCTLVVSMLGAPSFVMGNRARHARGIEKAAPAGARGDNS
jgi:uncharacterized membrane protein YbhN (UPF0104 family)